MSTPEWPRDVMRRVGAVLIVVGLVGIAACAVTVANRQRYGSSLNIFALGAGIMVYRGHLGAVRLVVRWFSFMLGAVLGLPIMLVAGEFFFRRLGAAPPTEPWRWLLGGVSWGGLLALFYWVRQRLASLPVFEDNRPARSLMRTPETAVGIGLAVLLTIVLAAVAVHSVPK